MSLSAAEVEEIMRLLDASRFDRLTLEMDGMKLELARDGSAPRPTTSGPIEPDAPEPVESPEPPPTAPAPRASVEEGLEEIVSPLLGVFYRAPKPGEAPFVEVGSTVAEDTVIGIVEVMKLMNSVRAGVRGEVVEILASDGELIEHGQVLLLVRPD